MDRLTHRVHILEINGDRYPLKQSRSAAALRLVVDPLAPGNHQARSPANCFC